MEKIVKEKIVKEKKVQKEKKEPKEKKEKEEEHWSFYIILHPCGATYAGVSPDPVKRLRKHNGELAGGAKYTLSKGKGWQHICLVRGFQTKIQALQFEWASKHIPPRNVGGIESRLRKLYTLFNKTYWTSKAPAAATVPLSIEWMRNEANISYAIFYGAGLDRTVPNYIEDLGLAASLVNTDTIALQ
jgi:predicted GIY-YIG superfamily endonuclease